MKLRADLHSHGPIGFQPYWLKKQGYAGRNLLKLVADQCFKRGITICAVTSQAEEIPRGSVQDRLGILAEVEAPLLPENYGFAKIGDNILYVERTDNIESNGSGAHCLRKSPVYFVNGQTVMPIEKGQKLDVLVVGSNQVPNGMSLRDTLKYGRDHGLIQIAEHPFVTAHRGIGEKNLRDNLEYFDGIEGHNSQCIFPEMITRIPVIGTQLSKAGRELNKRAQEFAEENGKSWIATSDSHRIEDIGTSYLQWSGILNVKDDSFFDSLRKEVIIPGSFSRVNNYVATSDWIRWMIDFQIGIRSGRVVDEYIPSNKLD